MTTIQEITLECPVCENRFDSRTVASTNGFGGKQTDFRERAAGTQPLPFLVHTCDRCGYSGELEDFSGEVEISPALRDHVWSELAPRLLSGPLPGSEKYELAAKAAAWQDAEPLRVAELLLRAAWCSADEGDHEAERYFRRHAAWAYQAALGTWDGVPLGERAVITYLVGELWRRIGDLTAARAWFGRVRGEIVDGAAQRWILDAARQQVDNPREWFA